MNKITAFFAALYHDVGKPATTTFNEKKQYYQSIGHENESAIITDCVLTNFVPSEYLDSIIVLIQNHMLTHQISDKKIRKLADEIHSQSKGKVCLFDLLLLRSADGRGRIGDKSRAELDRTNSELAERIRKLGVMNKPLEQLITGKDLINIGFKEGKMIGQIISEIRTKQYTNEIKTKEEALDFALRRYNNISFEENEKTLKFKSVKRVLNDVFRISEKLMNEVLKKIVENRIEDVDKQIKFACEYVFHVKMERKEIDI
jgi:tRNA nucleotidyltransferase (CCA-adding enzyme)